VKILVFGANSLLGQDLVRVLDARGVDFDVLASEDVDILKPREVMSAVSRSNPTQLVNVATYSNLQKAESDPEAAKLCDLVNTEGVHHLPKSQSSCKYPSFITPPVTFLMVPRRIPIPKRMPLTR